MGLCHNGSMTDASLFTLAEASCVCLPDVQASFGIKLMMRFKDDKLLVAGRFTFHKCVCELRQRCSKTYALEVVQVEGQKHGAGFLSVYVWVEATKLRCMPNTPKHLKIPQNALNNHPMRANSNWPLSMLRNKAALCHVLPTANDCMQHVARHLFGA